MLNKEKDIQGLEEKVEERSEEFSNLTDKEIEKVSGGAVGVAQYSRMVKERFEREKKELQSAGN